MGSIVANGIRTENASSYCLVGSFSVPGPLHSVQTTLRCGSVIFLNAALLMRSLGSLINLGVVRHVWSVAWWS